MTDYDPNAGSQGPVRRSLDDIAHLAVSDPTKLQPADVTRLGVFYLDHGDHLAFHQRTAHGLAAGQPQMGTFGRRMFGERQRLSKGPADSTAVDPVTDPALASAEHEDPKHSDAQ